MSKQVEQWTCDHCGAVHPSKKLADECEASHDMPVAIATVTFNKTDVDPYALKIKFASGKELYYYASED